MAAERDKRETSQSIASPTSWDTLNDEQAQQSPDNSSATVKDQNDHAKGAESEESDESVLTEEESGSDSNNETTTAPKEKKRDKVDNTNERTSTPQNTTPSKSSQKQTGPSSTTSWGIETVFRFIFGLVLVLAIKRFVWSSSESVPSSHDPDWRLKIDPNNNLPAEQRFKVLASLRPILDEPLPNYQEKVYTLLILSSNEETAAKLGRCLLQRVNTQATINQLSTEIDLRSYTGDKVALDSNLRTLLTTSNTIRAVLLRGIDNMLAKDELDRLNLLFAYCDGINPVIEHRLIIMTATSISATENELREKFKTRWPEKYDFIDPLMSRISGHTVYIDENQNSIC